MTPRETDPLYVEDETAVGRVAPGSLSVPERFRDGITSNLDAIAVVTAIAVVGWMMPLGDRFGFVLGLALAGMGSLAIFSRRW